MSSTQPAPEDRHLPRGHLLVLNRSFRRTLEAENKSPRTIEAYTDAVRLLQRRQRRSRQAGRTPDYYTSVRKRSSQPSVPSAFLTSQHLDTALTSTALGYKGWTGPRHCFGVDRVGSHAGF
jgi:hypothetical protein